jgi:lysophospholipase L1-like esterase
MPTGSNHQLPRLRRPRRPLNVAQLAGLVSKGVAKINRTVEPVASYWDQHNARALRSEGPLWVALGDSTTQGIGASHPRHSYPALVLEELSLHSDRPWRLINLSMSGGRFEDVVELQLPAMHDADLRPDLLSAVIGSNDVIWRRHAPSIVSDAERLVAALPQGTVLSRVSEPRPDQRRAGVNAVFDAASRESDLHLFEAWSWPEARDMWAEDRFHPNDRAYRYMADNLWAAFREALDLEDGR